MLTAASRFVHTNDDDPLRVHVHAMWEAASKLKLNDGKINRTKCWKYILEDEVLPQLIAFDSDKEKGKAMLLAMQSAKALDQLVTDDKISKDEFRRLYDSAVLASAEKECSGSP